MRQIAIGLHDYTETNPSGDSPEEKVPFLPAGTIPNTALAPDQRLSWFVEVLPFIQQRDLYRRIDRKGAWDSSSNLAAVQTVLNVLRCPDWVRESSPQPGYLTPYLGIAGLGADAPSLAATDRKAGVFGYDRRIALTAIRDGTSFTLLMLESARDSGPWAKGGSATVRGLDPADRPYLGSGRPFGGTHFDENFLFWKGKSIGCQAAMADASVRFIRDTVAPGILEAMATVAGEEHEAEPSERP